MYHVIVNPKSRSGLGKDIWIKARKRMMLEGIPFEAYITRYRGNAREIAGRLTGEMWRAEDILLVIGGDGTVNEVVDGIVRLKDVRLAYIPTGSGNDFARGLGIFPDPETALERALHPSRVIEADIGRNTCEGRSGRFTISTGIGFDAGICHEALASRIKDILNRLKLGKLTYACIALRQLAAFSPCTVRVKPENGEVQSFERCFFAVAMNLPYEGGGLKFTPDARPDDGILEVMIVSGIPKWKVLAVLPLAFSGRHTRFREVHMIRCRSIEIFSGQSMPVHLDGESGGYQKRMKVSLEPERLRILL